MTQPTDRCIIAGSVISLCERGRFNLFRITKTDLGSLGVNYTLQNYNKHIEAWMPIHTIKYDAWLKKPTNDEVKEKFHHEVNYHLPKSEIFEQELD